MITVNNKSIVGNRKILLNYIRVNEPVSRTDVYQNTPLSKPTVSRIVDDLVKSNILMETGVDQTTVGRKPISLKVNPKAFHCIGLNITRKYVKGAILDIDRKIIARKEESVRYVKDEGELLEVIKKVVDKLILQSELSIDNIIGIGIGVPCIVDYKTGVLIDFDIKKDLRTVELRQYLERAFSLPVYMDNNANTRVMGEYWYGYGKGYKNIIYVMCNDGVGSGIIAEGNILRGNNSVAGEIGHQKVEIDGRVCTCGKKGCLEAYCSTDAVEAAVRDELKMGTPSIITEYIDEDHEATTFELISKCASHKDILCSDILAKSEKVLGVGVSNIINILNPDIMIFSGEFFKYRDGVLDRVKAYAKELVIHSVGEDTIFMQREAEDILGEASAATLVYKDIFN